MVVLFRASSRESNFVLMQSGRLAEGPNLHKPHRLEVHFGAPARLVVRLPRATRFAGQTYHFIARLQVEGHLPTTRELAREFEMRAAMVIALPEARL
jgi:hypothetical protein